MNVIVAVLNFTVIVIPSLLNTVIATSVVKWHHNQNVMQISKMSEYQYYEFCSISKPLTREARMEMASLSSRAQVSTHGASYVYNYGDFKGNPKQLLLKHFDVFFYISNFGGIRLLFKYLADEINIVQMKKYCIKDVISTKTQKENVLLDIDINLEEGFGWVEGEGMLVDLLPLYDEIKTGNYQFLKLVSSVNEGLTEEGNTLKTAISKFKNLSIAQEAFLTCVGI